MYANRLTLLVALAVFPIGTLVLPVLRLRALVGRTGIVLHRAPSAIHRFVSAALGAYAVAAVAWAVLYAWVGAASLGVWATSAGSQAFALTLLMAGFALIVTAQWQMGISWRVGIEQERTPLVTGGLYRLSRNPIYSGVLLVVLGVACLTPSPWTILSAGQAAMVVALQARLEEDHLARTHGQEFRAYAARVGRFWPGVGRLA
jgi:protein-S-isoprenylcysteine O-methyltransferase Ste14